MTFREERPSRVDERADGPDPIVDSDRQTPGVHLAAAGISVRELIERPGPRVVRRAAIDVPPGGAVALESRLGKLTAYARADRGMLFMPFAFNEAAANLLTNDALDPFGKIPEFKFCAVKLGVGETVAAAVL